MGMYTPIEELEKLSDAEKHSMIQRLQKENARLKTKIRREMEPIYTSIRTFKTSLLGDIKTLTLNIEARKANRQMHMAYRNALDLYDHCFSWLYTNKDFIK